MALKVGREFKIIANRNTTCSSSFDLVYRVRFLTTKTEEIFETLTKYRSILGREGGGGEDN